MKTIPFHEHWTVRRMEETEEQRRPVTLPHDAMIAEPRNADSCGGTNTGWFEAHDYEYLKTFTAPVDWADQEVFIAFEGIYHNAELYVNNERLYAHPNGYFGFSQLLNGYLHFGETNTIRVIAHNRQQPNSRWYSGAGIYRPVWIHLLPHTHIVPESITVKTIDWKTRTIMVSFVTNGTGAVKVQMLDGERMLSEQVTRSGSISLKLDSAELWSPEHPQLYTCRLIYGEDIQEVRFGIRTIECDAKEGFRVNGKRTLLLGACIHHDNGLLGAVGHPFAERRKIQLIKKAGYNAIRSAHHPVSKAILDACDELGVMVLDEYADMWYIHKTQYDYAGFFEKNWENDLRLLVEKDKNHPSVVMYSIGNEVSETSQKKGIELTGRMRDYLHELDDRPVTCGINIFFNFLFSLGFGVYSDDKAKAEITKAEKSKGKAKKKTVGSEFINRVAGLLGADFMKFGATLHGSDVKTRDAFAHLDVAGYNYGIKRYRKDLKKYPNRVILGSETFCSDVVAFYDLAQSHPALIGDFVWAGMDYLGEVGLGAWEYATYAPDFRHGPGWVTAGTGTLDLIGTETSQLAYTQVAFGLTPVRIGVIPVKYAREKHSPAAWRMTNAVESWSWNGCEGMGTTVEVYARGAETELMLNGKSLGKKRLPASQRTKFRVTYQPGELTAIVYDENGKETARTSLTSAGEDTELRLIPEMETVHENELLYVRLRYTDKMGIVKPLVRGDISVAVEDGKLLALGNACSYNERGYLTNTTDTYYGEAMVIIQPDGHDRIVIHAESPYGTVSAGISCT